jgi:hypothetical protein
MFATTALDSCRSIADTVWTEFKRTAIIEIAQAQDEKIEEVKASCVSTMGECYDTQSGALKDFDTTSAQSSGAIAANAARQMCSDKVAACAALYGNGANCDFDDQGRVKNATNCGLGALLDYVATVDSTKIAEGCADALTKYAQEMCAPSGEGTEYPWGCRNRPRHMLEKDLLERASIYCDVSNTADDRLNTDLLDYANTVSKLSASISSELSIMLSEACDSVDGVWIDAEQSETPFENVVMNKSVYKADAEGKATKAEQKETYEIYEYGLPSEYANMKQLTAFMDKIAVPANSNLNTYGICIENNVKVQCEAMGGEEYATYDERTDSCKFTDKWYEQKCSEIGGYYEKNICYYAE